MGANPNTMDIKAVWDKVYQITHYKRPVYKAFASERLAAQLQEGDTVHRTYASDFTVNNMGGDGSYNTQPLTDSDETLVVNQKKEVSFYIPNWQQIQFHLDVHKKYAEKAMYRLWNQVDGDILLNLQQNTSNAAVDDGSLGGTSGNGITVGVGNVSQIFYTAYQTLLLANVEYEPSAKFSGNVKADSRYKMAVAAISPQVYNQLQQFLGSKNSSLGDNVSVNGHVGRFAGWDIFVSNNLPWEATLALATNPTDGDTITIGGLVFTFKNTIGATKGNVKIASSAALTNANLINVLNNVYTSISTGTDVGYVAYLTTDLTIAQQLLFGNITATNPTSTTTKIVVSGVGTVVVAQSQTAAGDIWTAALQKQHCIFGTSQSIDLVMQRTPVLFFNNVTGKVGKDTVCWNLYGFKVFTEQKPQIIDVQINSSSFTAPTQTVL